MLSPSETAAVMTRPTKVVTSAVPPRNAGTCCNAIFVNSGSATTSITVKITDRDHERGAVDRQVVEHERGDDQPDRVGEQPDARRDQQSNHASSVGAEHPERCAWYRLAMADIIVLCADGSELSTQALATGLAAAEAGGPDRDRHRRRRGRPTLVMGTGIAGGTMSPSEFDTLERERVEAGRNRRA